MSNWKHYCHPVYWYLPDDGASFKCVDCRESFSHKDVILTQIPEGDSRATLCLECVDEDWLKRAECLGMAS